VRECSELLKREHLQYYIVRMAPGNFCSELTRTLQTHFQSQAVRQYRRETCNQIVILDMAALSLGARGFNFSMPVGFSAK